VADWAKILRLGINKRAARRITINIL